MNVQETPLRGAYTIDLEPKRDERGFFARQWCVDTLASHGLVCPISQINVGSNLLAGTVRGLHYQTAPHAEVKVLRCTAGAVYDVIVDLRPESATFKQWFGVELSAENHRTLYVPEGFAQGYQTLTDNAEIYYMTTKPFAPQHATGVRYDDPAFGIRWPRAASVISQADQSWANFAG
jgi:dTDP-4-dehydrorhamnose 3,5-epimerase